MIYARNHSDITVSEQQGLGVTVLGSGSRGNAVVVHADGQALLVDAGFSARELRRRMDGAGVDAARLKAIVVSHEHSDHVRGLRVLANQLELPIFSNRETAEVLRQREPKLGKMHIFAPGSSFAVGDFTVEPFSIPHDAHDPVGFAIHWQDRKVGLATDLGHASHSVCYRLRDCNLLILESNHDIEMLRNCDRPWSLKQRIMGRHGHLSNVASMDLFGQIVSSRTSHLVLAHASQECNTYELAEKGARDCLESLGRNDIKLHVATQDASLDTLWL